MAKFAKFIRSFLECAFGKAAARLCSIAEKLLEYLLAKHKQKADAQKKKEAEKAKKRIDDICDNGTLDDLLSI